MKYQNASLLLPDNLVEELQKYIQGGYLYVPAPKDQHKSWGELTGSRLELRKRNEKIRQDYLSGASVDQLADRYYLSSHAIRKIIYQKI